MPNPITLQNALPYSHGDAIIQSRYHCRRAARWQDSTAPDGADTRKAQSTYGKHALFILFSWNHPLLRTALQAYVAAGLGPHIFIIDNSPDKHVMNDRPVSQPPRHQMTASCMLHRSAQSAHDSGCPRISSAMPYLCRLRLAGWMSWWQRSS